MFTISLIYNAARFETRRARSLSQQIELLAQESGARLHRITQRLGKNQEPNLYIYAEHHSKGVILLTFVPRATGANTRAQTLPKKSKQETLSF